MLWAFSIPIMQYPCPLTDLEKHLRGRADPVEVVPDEVAVGIERAVYVLLNEMAVVPGHSRPVPKVLLEVGKWTGVVYDWDREGPEHDRYVDPDEPPPAKNEKGPKKRKESNLEVSLIARMPSNKRLQLPPNSAVR